MSIRDDHPLWFNEHDLCYPAMFGSLDITVREFLRGRATKEDLKRIIDFIDEADAEAAAMREAARKAQEQRPFDPARGLAAPLTGR